VIAVLSGREERALSGIEAIEAARDPAFARRFNSRRRPEALTALHTALGPVLCIAAVPITILLLAASPWLGLVGVALFTVGLVLSIRPAAKLGERLFATLDRRRTH
jgi:Protein of unknown function (DUF3040)